MFTYPLKVEKHIPDICAHLFEPFLELRILVCVTVNIIE